MVFLLAGPATNVVTITILAKELGKKAVAIYLVSISMISILSGMILNQIWEMFAFQENMLLLKHHEVLPQWVEVTCSLVLLSLIARIFLKEKLESFRGKRDAGISRDKGNLKETILEIPDMTCRDCAKSITGALIGVDGIKHAEVILKDKTVKVLSDENTNREMIEKIINSAGYEVKNN